MPKHSVTITKDQPRHPVHFHKSGDVILQAHDVLFRVHRGKLSRSSKVFKKMFSSKRMGVTEGGKTPKVDLQDDPDQLALLFDFIYHCEINYKNLEQCLQLILLAHEYEAPLVISTCLDQIKAQLPTGATPRDLKAVNRFRNKPALLGPALRVATLVDIPGFLPWAIYLLSTDRTQKCSFFVQSEDDLATFKKFNKKVDALRASLPKLITWWNKRVEEHFLFEECSIRGPEDLCLRRLEEDERDDDGELAQLARIAIGATPESVDGPDMRSPPPQPQLVLAPARHTTVVTTTTTTTTTYQPISLPALPPAPSSPKDPKLYPLLHAPVPSHLRQFPLTFPNGARAIFKDPSFEPDVEAKRSIRQGTYDEERVGGQGWELLRPEDRVPLAKGKGKAREDVIHLAEAVDRYQLGRQKRVYESDNDMEGVEMAHQTISQAPSMPDLSVMGLVNSPPPRKKARASTIPIPPTTQSLVAPPSPLPSPSGSPSSTPIQLAPPTPPIQPDLTLTTLLALPQLVSHFSALPPNLQSHVLLQLLRQSTLPVLRNVHSVLTPALARDFLTLLPPELTAQILAHLPPSALFAAARVSRAWRQLIDQDMTLWRALLKATRTWFGGPSELAYMTRTLAIRERNPDLFMSKPQPHPFKLLYRRREQTRRNWLYNQPRRLTFPAHGSSVVTCLLFSRNRIISASDDHQIHVYSPTTGELILRLEGHEGGVWALAVSPNSPSAPHATDSLVSGSTDRTVRIWDLSNGKCTHVFGGHTSTVRCLAIVKPMWIDVNGRKEKWPKRTLIVTGSRDHTLRVWKLPRQGDPEYRCVGADGEDVDPAEDDANRNPYHVRLLSGHTHAVRALAAHGRTLISGSYDTTVRVWDIVTGECKWTLDGHSQKVYSVVLDPQRNQAMSGSMDGTVRIWSLATGQALHTLTGHSSLVGLLGLSPTHLVSAAADSTLRIWDPQTGALQHTLSAHTGAITCFQHDEFKVLSGSDGTLKMWDVREGSVVRDLLTGITGVWQVVFEGRWCVAASNRQEQTYLDVWDFGGEDPENELEAEEGDWMEASEDESEPEDGDDDIDVVDEGGDLELGDEDEEEDMEEDRDDAHDPSHYRQSGSSLQHRAPGYSSQRRFAALSAGTLPTSSSTRNGIGLGMLGISMAGGAGSSSAPPLPLPDQTPTRPRINRGSRASGSTSSRPY